MSCQRAKMQGTYIRGHRKASISRTSAMGDNDFGETQSECCRSPLYRLLYENPKPHDRQHLSCWRKGQFREAMLYYDADACTACISGCRGIVQI